MGFVRVEDVEECWDDDDDESCEDDGLCDDDNDGGWDDGEGMWMGGRKVTVPGISVGVEVWGGGGVAFLKFLGLND